LEIDLSQPLGREALSAISILTNPDLVALRTSEGVAQAQAFAAGLFPDPTFSIGVDRPLNGGSGVITAIAAALGIDLAELIRRPYRIQEARANLEAVRWDIVWAEWLTGAQARLLATRAVHLERSIDLAEEFERLSADLLSRALRATSRGDLAASELEIRRVAASDAAARARSLEALLVDAKLELNRILGFDPSEVLVLEAPRQSLTSWPTAEDLFTRAVEQRADLAALRAAYDGSMATAQSAQLGRYPLPSISLNGARDTSDVRTLGPAVSVTLPLWNRGRGEIAVVQATRAQLRAEYSARLETIRAEVAATLAALELARRQHAEVARNIEPLIPRVVAAERAVRNGDLPLAVAATSRLTLLDQQIVERELAQSVAELEVALEIATGTALESTP
jgi:outer membrane protein TolC